MLYHEFSAKEMKLIDFTEVKVNVKNKIINILNQSESICECLIKKREILDFELPVDECDLEDSDFDADENNETFGDKESEKGEVRNIPFQTK